MTAILTLKPLFAIALIAAITASTASFAAPRGEQNQYIQCSTDDGYGRRSSCDTGGF